MTVENHLPDQNNITLAFKDSALEAEFQKSYDKSVKVPLRFGILISLLSWYSAIGLIYVVIPDDFGWLSLLTIVYIGSFFGFIVYSTFYKRFEGYYHLMGAISNVWAGLYAIYFCDQFPNGEHLTLPVLIFIIFFGSYMVRLRWMAGFIAALIYTVAYHWYIVKYSELPFSQVTLYAFVAWMTLLFAILAGRVTEGNNRIAFVQRKTIREQSEIIEKEKEFLLQEVHHRVKNNLQIIVSLINLQRSKFDNTETNVALKEIQSRVLSMSLVHQRMNRTSNFTDISLLDYSNELIDNINHLYDGNNFSFDLDIADDISIDIETAIPMGLVINEIVTNFFKHCSCDENGQRSFKFQLIKGKEKEHVLKYTDSGTGFPDNVNSEGDDTLGLELIQSLTDQVSGEFKFYNGKGAVYEIALEL